MAWPNFIFWSSYYELNWKEFEFLIFDWNNDCSNICSSSDILHFTLILSQRKNFLSFSFFYKGAAKSCLYFYLFVERLKLLFDINCFRSFLQVSILIIPGNSRLFRIVLWFIIFSFFIFYSIYSGFMNTNYENFGDRFFEFVVGLWGLLSSPSVIFLILLLIGDRGDTFFGNYVAIMFGDFFFCFVNFDMYWTSYYFIMFDISLLLVVDIRVSIAFVRLDGFRNYYLRILFRIVFKYV